MSPSCAKRSKWPHPRFWSLSSIYGPIQLGLGLGRNQEVTSLIDGVVSHLAWLMWCCLVVTMWLYEARNKTDAMTFMEDSLRHRLSKPNPKLSRWTPMQIVRRRHGAPKPNLQLRQWIAIKIRGYGIEAEALKSETRAESMESQATPGAEASNSKVNMRLSQPTW